MAGGGVVGALAGGGEVAGAPAAPLLAAGGSVDVPGFAAVGCVIGAADGVALAGVGVALVGVVAAGTLVAGEVGLADPVGAAVSLPQAVSTTSEKQTP